MHKDAVFRTNRCLPIQFVKPELRPTDADETIVGGASADRLSLSVVVACATITVMLTCLG
jgi:hypothetical protein